jgi:Tfp pilus assembly pilus retraction ATPase PilT
MSAAIDTFLRAVRAHDGSDLHLMVGLPPRARVSGSLITLAEFPVITTEQMESLLHEICPPVRWEFFQKNRDLDFAYEIPGARPLPRQLSLQRLGARPPSSVRFPRRFCPSTT